MELNKARAMLTAAPQIKDKFNLNFSLRMGNSIKLSFLCLGALCVLRMKWTMKQRGRASLQLGLGLLMNWVGYGPESRPIAPLKEENQTKQPQQRASEPQREREQIDETKREGKSMKLIMEWNGIIDWMIAATSLFVESICGASTLFFLANSTIPSFVAVAGEANKRMELVGVGCEREWASWASLSLWVNGAGTAQCSANKRRQAKPKQLTHQSINK